MSPQRCSYQVTYFNTGCFLLLSVFLISICLKGLLSTGEEHCFILKLDSISFKNVAGHSRQKNDNNNNVNMPTCPQINKYHINLGSMLLLSVLPPKDFQPVGKFLFNQLWLTDWSLHICWDIYLT